MLEEHLSGNKLTCNEIFAKRSKMLAFYEQTTWKNILKEPFQSQTHVQFFQDLCMFCRGWRGPRIQTLTPLESLQRVCDLMRGHICYGELKMQQGCLLFLRCICSEKHRCSADSEVRVPSTESKTSFPAAPQLILWDLQPRRGQRSWGHRTKTAGQPPAQVHLLSDSACRQKRTLWSRGLLPAGSKDNSCNWFEKPDRCNHRVTWERGCTCAVGSTRGLRIWEWCRGCSLKAPCTQFRQDDALQLGRETAGLSGTSQDHLDDRGPKPTLDICVCVHNPGC